VKNDAGQFVAVAVIPAGLPKRAHLLR